MPEYVLEWGDVIQGAQGEGDQVIESHRKIIISDDLDDPDQAAEEKAREIFKKLSASSATLKKAIRHFKK